MSEEIETLEPKEKIEIVEATEENTEDIDAAFKEFINTKSDHTFEETHEETNTSSGGGEPIPEREQQTETFDLAADFKLKLFLNLFFLLLDGVHAFVYNMFSKYKIKREDIALEDGDKEGLEVYFRTPRIMGLINKLPPEIIGLVHIEYLYFEKFKDFKKEQEEKERLALEAQKEEEEQEQEEQEETELQEQEEEREEEEEQEQEEQEEKQEQIIKPKRKYKKRKRSRRKTARKKPVKKEEKSE